MSWREQIEPDWFHEAPFYLAAIIAHGALLSFNPVINWGGLKPPEKAIPIEFVAELPLPPAVQPPPKPKPVKKPAAVKSKASKPGATVIKAKAAPKPRPLAKPKEDAQAVKFAREAQAESKRLRAERDRAARALVAERAAEAKAAKAAKRAELASALATMEDPDEALAAAPPPSPSGRGSARKGRPAAAGPVTGKGGDGGAFGESEFGEGGGLGGGEAELAGARKAGAAAALAESSDPGDEAGSGGADLRGSKARGGGIGPEGGGVSFSVDGAVGSRRIVSRVAPTSPDWVATRSLDLTVTIRFQVLPDGSVKPGAVIQKTSGFPDIDARALKALARWHFQPVAPKPGAPEVWGRVTFRFTS